MTLLEVAKKWNALSPDDRKKKQEACMDRGGHRLIGIPVGGGCKIQCCQECLVVFVDGFPLNSLLP